MEHSIAQRTKPCEKNSQRAPALPEHGSESQSLRRMVSAGQEERLMKYSLIYADPAWEYGNTVSNGAAKTTTAR
jgi:hypothetical protein